MGLALVGRGFIVAVALASCLALADVADASCCTCGGQDCPQAGFCTSAPDANGSNNCNGLCDGPLCGKFTDSPDSICGQGMSAGCTVIDPTATSTATETETATATATATATETATSTGTATSTPTASPVPQGGACNTPSQCSTLECADGVCCDTACDAPLEQCNLPGQVGTCATTAAGAPAASSTGLLVMLGVLLGAAFVALPWRRA